MQAQILAFTPKNTYEDVRHLQEEHVQRIINGAENEYLLMGEHAPIYTLGTSAKASDVLHTHPHIPSLSTGRGGEVTYHGPGQRVLYPLVNLKNYQQDIRWYIKTLQRWIIETLAEIGIDAFITDDIGVWVNTPKGAAKIAAIGVRVRKWVTFHGVALNVAPNLSHFDGIVPCGLTKPVTSIKELGFNHSMAEIDKILLAKWPFCPIINIHE